MKNFNKKRGFIVYFIYFGLIIIILNAFSISYDELVNITVLQVKIERKLQESDYRGLKVSAERVPQNNFESNEK